MTTQTEIVRKCLPGYKIYRVWHNPRKAWQIVYSFVRAVHSERNIPENVFLRSRKFKSN